MKQLFDEVNVGQHHAAAAVSLQSEGIKGVTVIQIKSIKNERMVKLLFSMTLWTVATLFLWWP